MKNKELVSIIIPVYNAQKYIKRCLTSVLNQSYTNIEIIVINDGSTDKSEEIVESLAKKDSRIKLLNQNNQGAAKTRNTGIKKATGEYIMFIDNDDYIEKDYVNMYVNNIKKNDIVIGGYRRVSNKKEYFKVKGNSKWYPYLIMAPWAKLYRKDFIIKNKIEFLDYAIGEDSYFSINAYGKAKSIKIIDYIGYNWFFNEESISNTTQRGFNKKIDIKYLLEKLYEVFPKENEFHDYYFLRYGIWYLLFSGRNAKKEEFMEEYKKIFSWLKEKKIPINRPEYTKEYEGESLKNKISILIFTKLHKWRLINLFAKIYCRR